MGFDFPDDDSIEKGKNSLEVDGHFDINNKKYLIKFMKISILQVLEIPQISLKDVKNVGLMVETVCLLLAIGFSFK